MEDLAVKQLRDLYGLNPNIPHLAFQFPRLPPSLSHPMFQVFENPMKEKMIQNSESLSKKLQGFQEMYRQYASGLFTMNFTGAIPPGHPLYAKQNSIDILKTENDKLLKENLELKKKLDEVKEN